MALPLDTTLEVCPACVVHSAFRTANVNYHGIIYTSEQEEFVAGQQFGQGRFTLLRRLGAGGMGVVWLARDEHLSQTGDPIQVALKFLSPRIRSHSDAMAMLRDEVIRSRQLRHERIVSIYDWHAAPNEPAFISMEYIEGDNFSDVLRQQTGQFLSWNELQRWVFQLCDALDYAHTQRNIIHRDLKPGNLMLTAQRELKLADFGLARVRVHHESGDLDRTQARGTPLYMSPEQMRGEPADVSDDIYSFGATLYELLSGTPPFFGGDIVDLVQNSPPQPLLQRLEMLDIPAEVPDEVRDTIMFCLEKNRKDRPQSMKQVAAWLKAPRSLPPARHPARYFWIVLGALALAATLLIVTWDPKDPTNGLGALLNKVISGNLFKRSENAGNGTNATPGSTNITSDPVIPVRPVPPPEPPVSRADPPQQGTLLRLMLLPPRSGTTYFSLRTEDPPKAVVTNGSFSGSECDLAGVPPGSYLLQATNAKIYKMAQRCEAERARTNLVRLNFAPARITNFCNEPANLMAVDWNGTVQRYPMSPRGDARWPYTNFAILDSPPLWPGPWTIRLEWPYYFTWETNLDLLPGTSSCLTNLLEKDFAPERNRGWTNSLGMVLAHLWVGTNSVWMSTTETTLEQFARFAAGTGLKEIPMAWVSSNGLTTNPVYTWRHPPLPPGTSVSEQPVVGVTWFEATNFCGWLTACELASHSLRSNQSYRLPTCAQWGVAAGPTLYPWGSDWPPGPESGNYADRAAQEFQWHEHWPAHTHDDRWARTAPVTMGAPNSQGFYHLGGNVAEWCLDDYTALSNSAEARRLNPFLEEDGGGTYKVLRGGSWYDYYKEDLWTATLQGAPPEARTDRYGFRIVLVE